MNGVLIGEFNNFQLMDVRLRPLCGDFFGRRHWRHTDQHRSKVDPRKKASHFGVESVDRKQSRTTPL